MDTMHDILHTEASDAGSIYESLTQPISETGQKQLLG